MDSGLATDALASPAFPWLSLIVLLPAFGALLMPLMPGDDERPSPWPRNLALAVLLADLLLMLVVFSTRFDPGFSGLQLVERVSWLPAIGLEWSLGADGLSAPLVVLSGLVTFLSVAASWSVQRKCKLYFALLLVQASAQGLVFLSQDFLLFFLAWELELVPVYLLIAIWGGQNRQYAATKFILYTALASLLILISGLALALAGDSFTLNLTELAARSPGGTFGLLCYLGFLSSPVQCSSVPYYYYPRCLLYPGIASALFWLAGLTQVPCRGGGSQQGSSPACWRNYYEVQAESSIIFDKVNEDPQQMIS